MKNYLLGLCLFCLMPLAFGQSVTKQAQQFDAIQHTVNHLIQQGTQPQQILLVLDDDGTISDMKFPPQQSHQHSKLAVALHGIGGVGWIHWQQHLQKRCAKHPGAKPCSYLVADHLQNLYNAQAIIFRARWPDVVQPQLVQSVKALQRKGVKVIGETARPPSMAKLTQDQLHHMINDKTGHFMALDLSSNALQSQQSIGAQGYFNCSGLAQAPLLYQQGILYVTGQNKGQALHCLFHQLRPRPHFKAIIFVDDLQRNVQAVAQAFQNHKGIKVWSYHYTADKPYKNVNKQQAQHDWQAIKRSFHKQLLKHARYQ